MATGTKATPGAARAGQQPRPGAPGQGRGAGRGRGHGLASSSGRGQSWPWAGAGRGHQGAPSPPAPERSQALHGLATSLDRAHRVKAVALVKALALVVGWPAAQTGRTGSRPWRWSRHWRWSWAGQQLRPGAPGQGRGAGRGHQGAPSPPAPERSQALHGLANSSGNRENVHRTPFTIYKPHALARSRGANYPCAPPLRKYL